MTAALSVGLITGMDFEAAAVRRAARRARLVLPPIAVGPGCRAAEAAAATLADAGARALVSLGFCGALAPDLTPGRVVLADRLLAPDGDGTLVAGRPALDAAAARLTRVLGAPPVIGALVHGDVPLATAEAKAAAHGRTGALGVDMESLGVARAATAAGVPWLSVRLVLDTAAETLPPAALAGFAPGRGTSVWPVIATLARRPQDLPGLLRLAHRRAAVTRDLEAVARAGLPDFGLPQPSLSETGRS
ncbi:hypothetical protein CCR85_09330 [Rhodothalassium salexigens]|uniref:phosphorylase family protein n=1 Tax=Rhodothalassium salexigens TaxID=1086 RepID=UPI001914634D|nr:hypothetical protein [Rhodothalassium salexigens]MBK5911687.1 hypothetical protein [Rhodothalassium salexigens]MBK5919724.1 hypothetical protein [Rhodothalassium salexigens]